MKAYWISDVAPGKLGVVERPEGGPELPHELEAMRAEGCDLLVSLLTPNESLEVGLTREAAEARRAGMAFLELPVPDFGLPDEEPFRRAVERAAAAIERGRGVLAHCYGGIGRSPMFVAAVLVLRGEEPPRAWERVAEARGITVPETEEQREWLCRLRGWRP